MANDNDDSGSEVLAPDDVSTLPALVRAEIDVQIATAKRYPRVVSKFKKEAEELATIDQATAGSMFYLLKRKDPREPGGFKRIEGPSVRLAEIVGLAWGNLRYDSRTVEITDKHVVAQGTCLDLEKNNAARVEVRRRITNREGRLFSEDMIVVTANAACSIALRQAIFKIVPFTYIKEIFAKAKEVSIGKGMTMEQRRDRALGWFKERQSATEKELLQYLGRKGVEDITVEDLIDLQGTKTAIEDGDTDWPTIRKEFTERKAAEAAGGLDELANKHRDKDTGTGTGPVPEKTETTGKSQPENKMESTAQKAKDLF